MPLVPSGSAALGGAQGFWGFFRNSPCQTPPAAVFFHSFATQCGSANARKGNACCLRK